VNNSCNAPERAITLHVAHERALIAWAVLSLALVLIGLTIGGCS
jgi:uncharacterized membrane protein YidH (DUF202 family)